MIRESFLHFWERSPALLLGLALLLGIAASLSSPLLFTAIFLFLALSAQKKCMVLIVSCLFAFGYLSTPLRCPTTTLSSEKIEGTALFAIDSLQIHASPFSQSLVYRGTLKEFTTADGTIYRNLSCALFHPKTKQFPPANSRYHITGTLLQKGEQQFVLKPKPHHKWEPIADTHSFAQWRYSTKQSIASYLKKKISNPDARELLTALSTGEVNSRMLKMQFAKIGLQHILAISGFHFALVALFLYGILRILLPRIPGYVLLIAALSLYYFYLGNAPSIQRAYIALTLFCIGKIMQWRITGLNALGCALCVELLIDPLSLCHLGFQLSFLCTLAILLFYTPMHATVKHILPERNSKQLLSMSTLDKHAYLLSRFLRQSLSVNLAVTLIALPVLLYYFHQFPLLSLFYNLFVPLCVTLSLFLLLAAFLLFPLTPFIADALHSLNSTWTGAFMHVISLPPAVLQFTVRTSSINAYVVIAFLCLSLFIGIVLAERDRSERLAV